MSFKISGWGYIDSIYLKTQLSWTRIKWLQNQQSSSPSKQIIIAFWKNADEKCAAHYN